MTSRVKLNEVRSFFGEIEYPVTRAHLVDEYGDVELVYADGGERLPAVLKRTDVDEYESVGDLTTVIMNSVPVEGVGEPGQSEGEG